MAKLHRTDAVRALAGPHARGVACDRQLTGNSEARQLQLGAKLARAVLRAGCPPVGQVRGGAEPRVQQSRQSRPCSAGTGWTADSAAAAAAVGSQGRERKGRFAGAKAAQRWLLGSISSRRRLGIAARRLPTTAWVSLRLTPGGGGYRARKSRKARRARRGSRRTHPGRPGRLPL